MTHYVRDALIGVMTIIMAQLIRLRGGWASKFYGNVVTFATLIVLATEYVIYVFSLSDILLWIPWVITAVGLGVYGWYLIGGKEFIKEIKEKFLNKEN